MTTQRRSEQRWLVTGASSGFGREIARAVLDAGGSVLATARKPETLADLAHRFPDRCAVQSLDVTDSRQIAEAVRVGADRLGGIDVLVNNAGHGLLDSVEEADDAAVRHLFEVHFFAVVNMIRAVLPGMRAQRRGWIVNISSSGGRLSAPGLGYYSAAKHAVEGLSKGLRGEVAGLGIGVTVVEPGSFRTAFGNALAARDDWGPDYLDSVGVLAGRVKGAEGKEPGNPAEAARSILSALDAEEPPRQLLLGPDAIDGVRAALEAELAEVAAWAPLGLGTAFEDPRTSR
jgi:NADP-dependent 3-hydroxy acid dehydrogenase YdfG